MHIYYMENAPTFCHAEVKEGTQVAAEYFKSKESAMAGNTDAMIEDDDDCFEVGRTVPSRASGQRSKRDNVITIDDPTPDGYISIGSLKAVCDVLEYLAPSTLAVFGAVHSEEQTFFERIRQAVTCEDVSDIMFPCTLAAQQCRAIAHFSLAVYYFKSHYYAVTVNKPAHRVLLVDSLFNNKDAASATGMRASLVALYSLSFMHIVRFRASEKHARVCWIHLREDTCHAPPSAARRAFMWGFCGPVLGQCNATTYTAVVCWDGRGGNYTRC